MDEPLPDTAHLSDLEDETDSLAQVMAQIRSQMNEIELASKQVRSQVKGVYRRAKSEAVRWMTEPLTPRPHARAWMRQHRLPPTPTLEEFITAAFGAAISLDMETRQCRFSRKDADLLWGGRQDLSVFEMIALLPSVFA
jgi:hypothetical protein